MNAVTHLCPGMDSVAVGAQKPQVSLVDFPVLESVQPVAGSFAFLKFLGPINVVNVQNAMVINSAGNALPAKSFDKCELLFPVCRVLVSGVTVCIPVILTALVTAVPIWAGLPARLAGLILSPSVGKVARLPTELAGAIFQAIRMNLKTLRTVLTGLSYLGFFSHWIPLSTSVYLTSKYFEIACKRIEQAVNQGQLFAPEQPKQLQESFL